MAAELVNGETARSAFKDMTRDEYGAELDPKNMEVEFLSPTKAWPILQQRGETEGHVAETVWPTFMAAWVGADREKYNGMFAVEQLHQWALKAGSVTTDLQNPRGASTTYADFAAKSPEKAFEGFPATICLAGWRTTTDRSSTCTGGI